MADQIARPDNAGPDIGGPNCIAALLDTLGLSLKQSLYAICTLLYLLTYVKARGGNCLLIH